MKTHAVRSHMEGLSSENATTKYSSVRELLTIAEDRPETLYPHLDFFVKLLHSDNKILKWTAIDVVGSVAKIDKQEKLAGLINPMFNFLKSGELITANHAISALGAIAGEKPEYQKKITRELLQIEEYKFETEECRNIAIGKVILALGSYLDSIPPHSKVMEFVQRQTRNSRPATKKKAEELMKKINR